LKTITGTDSEKPLGDHTYDTFLSLLELVDRVIPSEQNKLVEFLFRLLPIRVADPTSGEPLKLMGRKSGQNY
jgi:hypothetical protein